MEILSKNELEASRGVFWSLSCYKELNKLTTKPFTGRTLRGLLIQMQIKLPCKVRACQESKILGLKIDTAILNFTFPFLSSSDFFRFSCLIFFFCWAFNRLHFGGKSLYNSFKLRIRLMER